MINHDLLNRIENKAITEKDQKYILICFLVNEQYELEKEHRILAHYYDNQDNMIGDWFVDGSIRKYNKHDKKDVELYLSELAKIIDRYTDLLNKA